MDTYTSETFRRVYDDLSGTYIQINPDVDGLNCVEICYVDPEHPEDHTRSISIPPKQAALVAQAILALAREMDPSIPSA